MRAAEFLFGRSNSSDSFSLCFESEVAALAKHDTLYVSRPLLNIGDIRRWAAGQGFPTLATDLHVTIAYSRAAVDWERLQPDPTPLTADAGSRRMHAFGDDGGAIVLGFASPRLHQRWEQFIDDLDCSWDFPTYQPHVTITYEGQSIDAGAIVPFVGPLRFGPEKWSLVEKTGPDADEQKLAAA